MKIRFKPNNNILFFQDMSYWRDLPSDVTFNAENISPGKWKLTAPGYGERPYGNGAIFLTASGKLPPLFEYLWKQEHGDEPY